MSVRISGKIIASNDTEIPSQGGNSGKFLSTNGSTVSWKNINNGVLTIQKNGSTIDTFSADSASNKTVNITVPTSAADVHALPDTTKYGASVVVSIDNTDYKMTTTLKDQDGNTLGTAQVIDLPLESVVVSGSYDSVNKKIILTLQNGNTIDIPVADLISGLQTEITPSNKLDADLVDDTTSTHKFVTATDISNWNATALPSQTGHNGEFLTTDGSSTSWAAVDALPAQTGQSGKFLTTDGTDASWATVDALPDQTGQSGKYLTTDGSNASWSGVNADSVKNNNPAVGATNPIYDWVGTLAEYTAQDVATNHPDWVCFITDDNGNQLIDFQLPTSQNSYTWYIKYANGLVLQGGRATTNNSGTPKFINIPVEMESTNYYPLLQGQTDQSSYNGAQWQIMPTANSTYPASTTGFYALGSITGYSLYFTWFIAGRYA